MVRDRLPSCLILGKMILLVNSIQKTEAQVIASIPTILLEFETGLKVYKIYTLSSLQLSILLFPVLLIILYKAGF